MTLNLRTFSIMTLGIVTLVNLTTFRVKTQHNITKHNRYNKKYSAKTILNITTLSIKHSAKRHLS
jgi:hypothetical protein